MEGRKSEYGSYIEETTREVSPQNVLYKEIVIDSECTEKCSIKSEITTTEQATLEVISKQKKYSCKFCNIPFLYKKRLQLHEKKHENGMKCYICGKINRNM